MFKDDAEARVYLQLYDVSEQYDGQEATAELVAETTAKLAATWKSAVRHC